ncbi:hypothetical protein PCASD_26410 [Puccinia coronata f. sp. avenae]|uniref:Uncharacterized protein n=1 Tax=Puccinia coronata f. sp. avenae TaxID=200324 RepID=A0A2N5S5V3_9BASI|nr:hypothetical protein PCASD_26410 [Puccinia coronata f. sp. avenae]
MYGTHHMMQVLDGWIAREELARLEQSTHLQTRRRQTQVRPAQAQLHQQAPVQQQQPSQEPMTPPPSPTATPPATGPLQGSQIQHPTAQETAPCPVATSTPIQPSPLRPAPTAKWKPVQPPLPKEQTPEVQRWPQQPQQQHSPLRSTSPNPQ